jgi:hypothetical protein
MKKSLLTQILVMSAGLIVLTAVVPVNHALLPTGQNGYTLVADGAPMPLPEPPPPPPSITALSFDGAPMPLPEPPPPPPSQIQSPALSDEASNIQS